ncbi:cation diffusion facilitator family transporter [Oscillatoria sp. CS-180]|uniref:cation diffusion facilitator family transporter n=1 Tax=Oscillatoria sp. CS-180 TaxID=3021720 RepID=UPI00232F2C58|nr:cation diffusion facilitator family transporter [Oscillatoria sp. CS-180]MDB9526099.1 cation diffusion facilitator family transporter [Oscillatoria sp. CS-180]
MSQANGYTGLNISTSHCSFCLSPTLKGRWLFWIMMSVTVFAGVELWVGLMSHSLTLRADSGHMLTDGAAIGLALTATWIARRSPAPTQGNHRIELLAALINSLALLAMAAWISREALSHWHGETTEILSTPMLITALLGLLVNALNLYWLHGDIRQDLNLRGIFLHILADLLGSVGAMLAAIAVTFLQWAWADTVIGAIVAVAIAVSALPLLWQTLHALFRRPQATLLPQETLQQHGWFEVGETKLSSLIDP